MTEEITIPFMLFDQMRWYLKLYRIELEVDLLIDPNNQKKSERHRNLQEFLEKLKDSSK